MTQDTMAPPADEPHEHSHRGGAERLLREDRFYAPMHAEIAAWLAIPPGSAVLDVGCGAGGMSVLLAEAVGPGGAVTAVDPTPESLETVRRLAAERGVAGRMTAQEASLDELPFPDASFDLVWCSRVVHGRPDQLLAARELRRVLKPGGRLALREGGLQPRFLPQDTGLTEPGLEERLAALQLRWFAGWRATMPDAVPYPFGWAQLLRDAGFRDVRMRSFLLERLPPLEGELGEYVVAQLRGWLEREQIAAWLTPEDRDALKRLTDPDGPDYALRRPDLHALAASSVYVGYRDRIS
jgi:ubiquinone/menaquinone biosynthesis C-methylase UbiE